MQTLWACLSAVVLAFAALRFTQIWVSLWGKWLLREKFAGSAKLRVGSLVAVGAFVFILWRGPAAGLWGLILLPLILGAGVVYSKQGQRRKWEEAGVLYFHALRGLVNSGLGLSSALFELARAQKTEFAEAMERCLSGFEKGKPLEDCLMRFDRIFPGSLVSLFLQNLQTAYRQGLSVAPLLDQMVPLLEAERTLNRKALDLRRSALVQGGVAFAVPWLVLGALWWVQPEMDLALPYSGILGAFTWECLGVVALWQISRFY